MGQGDRFAVPVVVVVGQGDRFSVPPINANFGIKTGLK